jgi:hypothetical protein
MTKIAENILLVRESDSPGYARLLFADPIGEPAAGAVVTGVLRDTEVEKRTEDGQAVTVVEDVPLELIVHGQREIDVPERAELTFPDGSTWKHE